MGKAELAVDPSLPSAILLRQPDSPPVQRPIKLRCIREAKIW